MSYKCKFIKHDEQILTKFRQNIATLVLHMSVCILY